MNLETIQQENKNCTLCSLRKTCSQVVPGIGGERSSILIIGEAPGKDEDIMGEPFVGRSGQLLNTLLKSASIDRNNIYISNTVKCNTPNNRKPSQNEIDTCKVWLWKEIKNLPELKVIAPLGAVATSLLLRKTNIPMKSVINNMFRVHWDKALAIMPWYHPSYLLRRNNQKLINETVQRFQQIKEASCA